MNLSQKLKDGLSVDIAVFIALTIFFATLAIKSYKPYTFLSGDASFYAQINRGIAEKFTLRQEEFQPVSWYKMDLQWNRNLDMAWSDISAGKNGEFYPKHPYLISVFSTPFYVLFGIDGLLIFNVIMTIFILFFAYLGASTLFSTRAIPAISTILIAINPVFTRMVYNYSNDTFYAALTSAGFFFTIRREGLIGGILFGLSIWAKPTNLLFFIPLCVFFLFNLRKKEFLYLCAGFSIPMGIYLLLNFIMFGSPFLTSYDRILTLHNGKEKIVSYKDALREPINSGLKNLFRSGGEGIINNFYLIFLLPAGIIPIFFKNISLGISLFLSYAVYFLFHAKFSYIYARFFLPWAGISIVPISYLIEVLSTINLPLISLPDGKINFKWLNKKNFLILFILILSPFLIKFIINFFSKPLPSLTKDVEKIKVYADNIPCDYFNMAFRRWECSHIEPGGGGFFTGEDIREECKSLSREQKLLWVPLPSNVEKRKIIYEVELEKDGGASFFYGLVRGSNKASLQFLIDDEKIFDEDFSEKGKLNKREILIKKGKHKISLILSSPQRKEIFSCLDLIIN